MSLTPRGPVRVPPILVNPLRSERTVLNLLLFFRPLFLSSRGVDRGNSVAVLLFLFLLLKCLSPFLTFPFVVARFFQPPLLVAPLVDLLLDPAPYVSSPPRLDGLPVIAYFSPSAKSGGRGGGGGGGGWGCVDSPIPRCLVTLFSILNLLVFRLCHTTWPYRAFSNFSLFFSFGRTLFAIFFPRPLSPFLVPFRAELPRTDFPSHEEHLAPLWQIPPPHGCRRADFRLFSFHDFPDFSRSFFDVLPFPRIFCPTPEPIWALLVLAFGNSTCAIFATALFFVVLLRIDPMMNLSE